MDTLKAILLVPLILGGAIAMMMLSYMVVPIMIVSFVIFMGFTVNSGISNSKKKSKKKEEKKRIKRREKAWARRKRLGY